MKSIDKEAFIRALLRMLEITAKPTEKVHLDALAEQAFERLAEGHLEILSKLIEAGSHAIHASFKPCVDLTGDPHSPSGTIKSDHLGEWRSPRGIRRIRIKRQDENDNEK